MTKEAGGEMGFMWQVLGDYDTVLCRVGWGEIGKLRIFDAVLLS